MTPPPHSVFAKPDGDRINTQFLCCIHERSVMIARMLKVSLSGVETVPAQSRKGRVAKSQMTIMASNE